MADEIRTMTAELARNPDSLVFLDLGEALRARGQLHRSAQVAVAGLERHPNTADAYDLYARVLVDMGHLEQAFEQWGQAIKLNARHLGAHKGMGFLSYRWGDLDAALEHLELALATDPLDASVVQALRIVRDAAEVAEAGDLPTLPAIFQGFEAADHGMLLADERGRVLGGGMRDSEGADAAADVAALAAGGGQEAERTTRILGMGDWISMVVEGPAGNVHISRPDPHTLLVVARDRSVPAGRLALLAGRAGEVARRWLEEQQP